ncbi:MAG: glycosyltransferase family 39 protein [Caldilineaceae bacterium]|nr:glycosyltransferase family 39 protein [Caldilineaceae bacterium]
MNLLSARRSAIPFLAATVVVLGAYVVFGLTRLPDSAGVWPRWVAMLTLAWWLPGLLLAAHWRLPHTNAPTFGVFALGLGFCWMMAGALLIHWLPGPISFWGMAALYGAGALGLSLFRLPAVTLQPTPRSAWLWLLALLVTAALFRLPGLGYHEFHYDEVLVLTRAREAIRGEDDAFARHAKGPGEIAVTTVAFRTLGTADETTARLPFALASVGAVLALALLAREMFRSDAVGFWGGVLFALNGFALGLSRIVQYQAGVMLLMILAVLAAWRFARSGLLRWLILSAVLGAWGLTLHYEFGLIAPALLYLAYRGRPNVSDPRRALQQLALVTLGGAALLLAVYLPIVRNPYFAQTQGYLDSRLGGLGRTFNLAFFVEMATFYNSIYYSAGLLILAVIGLLMVWRTRRTAAITLILWFTPFLLLYLFIVQFPGTHFYLLMPSWAILGGVALASLSQRLMSWMDGAPSRPVLRTVTGVLVMSLVIGWLGVSAFYLHLMFFRQNPEYLINYGQERVAFYWAPYGENVPEKPRFGFPIREGWKTLGVLSEWKYLNGTYASNERSRHLRWYLGDFDRVPLSEQPDFIFVARHVQEPDPAFTPAALTGYTQIGAVSVRGEPRIEIWSREPLSMPYTEYDAAAFDAVFMGLAPTFDEWPDPASTVTDVPLGDTVVLQSGGFAPRVLTPGDVLHVHLVWAAKGALPADYKRFLHMADASGRPVAQLDGYPAMETGRTSAWTPGEPIDDHILFVVPEDIPAGSYQLLTGLYDGETGERVGDQVIKLGEVRVR